MRGTSACASPTLPPTHANARCAQAPFTESFAANGSAYAVTNKGAWVVKGDVGTYVHGAGQSNNFCACASAAGATADDGPSSRSGGVESPECRLVFASDGWMRVFFPGAAPPGAQQCCQLCTAEEGCGLLLPDWLARANATYAGPEAVEGRECDAWRAEGAVATDEWLVERQGARRPCAYREHFSFPSGTYDHQLAFDAEGYRPGVVDEKLLDYPANCNKRCPKVFGQTCG